MVAQAIIWVIGSRPPRAVSELIAGCPVYRQLNRSQQLQGTGLDGPCISLSTATGRAKPYQQSLTVTILDRKKKKKKQSNVSPAREVLRGRTFALGQNKIIVMGRKEFPPNSNGSN